MKFNTVKREYVNKDTQQYIRVYFIVSFYVCLFLFVFGFFVLLLDLACFPFLLAPGLLGSWVLLFLKNYPY